MNMKPTKFFLCLIIFINVEIIEIIEASFISKAAFYERCSQTGRCLGVKKNDHYQSDVSESNLCLLPNATEATDCDYIAYYDCEHHDTIITNSLNSTTSDTNSTSNENFITTNMNNTSDTNFTSNENFTTNTNNTSDTTLITSTNFTICIELYAKKDSPSGYIAGALSEDRKMGDDLVFACIWNEKWVPPVHGKLFYNLGRSSVPLPKSNDVLIGFNVTSTYLNDTEVYCSMTLFCQSNIFFTYNDRPFLFDNMRNILVAGGGRIDGDKILHHDARMSSSIIDWHNNDTNRPTLALAPSYYAEKYHGSYMIFCWVTWIPIGTFVSRFYKETWANKYFMKKRAWFFIHITCMIMAFFMAITSYIFVASERQQFIPPAGKSKIHGAIGATALILLVLQCTWSWFRPTRTKPKDLAAKIHCGMGHVIYILGIINIILSPHFTYNVAPTSVKTHSIGWIAFHSLTYLLMTLYVEWTDWHLQTGGYRAWFGCPLPIITSEEAPRSTLRKSVLFLFSLVSLVISSVMIDKIQFDDLPRRDADDFDP